VRPRYETEDDLRREQFVADRLMEAASITLFKLPDSYGPDFFHKHRIIEVKCRKHSSDTYPTLLLALRKWRDGLFLAHLISGQFVVAVGFTDGIFTASVDPKNLPTYEIVVGGRTRQTRDDGDIEPVVHIPISDMTKITDASPWSNV
jgi:hypothetical protein